MPRFYLHLIDESGEVLLDPEGTETSKDRLAALALAAARDCMAGDVQSGHLRTHFRIDVQDMHGDVVHSLRFADAVTISRRPTPRSAQIYEFPGPSDPRP